MLDMNCTIRTILLGSCHSDINISNIFNIINKFDKLDNVDKVEVRHTSTKSLSTLSYILLTFFYEINLVWLKEGLFYLLENGIKIFIRTLGTFYYFIVKKEGEE